MIADAGDLPKVVRIDEQIAQLRIEGDPAPIDAAVVAREQLGLPPLSPGGPHGR